MKIITKPRMWVYHAETCRDGRIVWEDDGIELLKSGWMKNPNDFPKNITKKSCEESPRETTVTSESSGESRGRGRPRKEIGC